MFSKILFYSLTIILVSLFKVKCDDIRHYNGYSVLRLIPTTETQLQYLRELEENVVELDFWRGPSYVGRAVDVMIPPHLNQTFDKIFSKRSFEKTVLIEDLEKNLIEERAANKAGFPYRPINSIMKPSRNEAIPNFFNAYQRLSTIFQFLTAIQTQYPSITSVVRIGTSYLGKEIRLIKIGINQSSNTKPIIFIEAGIHAREWISPAFATYFCQQLVNGYNSSDPTIRALLQKFDFYILPVLNADGYEYTHTNDRMWRKTRKPYSTCYGADPNRNWGHQWGGAGASTNPCSETYRGPNAFSEPETKAASDYVLSLGSRVKAYLCIHSYGQYWLYPWGYTSALTPDDRDLNRLGNVAITELAKSYGTRYTIGTSTNVLYAAAGGADDWAYGKANIKYSYTVELRDTGMYGFNLPASQIKPTGIETTNGMIAFSRQLSQEV